MVGIKNFIDNGIHDIIVLNIQSSISHYSNSSGADQREHETTYYMVHKYMTMQCAF